MSPGARERTAATRALALPITRSSTLVTTTPLGSPAVAAAPPLTTSTILAPWASTSLLTCTPSEACEALPVLISSSAIRLAWSTGIAKPRPMLPPWASGSPPIVAIAEFTPTSSPAMFTSAPPELPGLIAASVWMASCTVFWLLASPLAATGRLSALTMPVVTVPSSPSGDPMATTGWPTRRSAEEPSVMGVRPVTFWARTTAMSLAGSEPTTVNDAVRPSAKVTRVVGCAGPGAGTIDGLPGRPGGGGTGAPGGLGPGPPLITETTWLLVRIRPSSLRMMPEPSSDCRPILVSSLTTLGTTLAATCSTEPTGTLAAGTLRAPPPGAAVVMVVTLRPVSGCAMVATTPPTPADSAEIASAPTVNPTARERFRG